MRLQCSLFPRPIEDPLQVQTDSPTGRQLTSSVLDPTDPCLQNESNPSYPTMQWTNSGNPIPNLFVAVPLLENRPIPQWRLMIRLIAPCQGPSLLSRGRDSLHITGHDGYTIEYPRNLEHRHRNGAKVLFSTLGILLKFLGMGGRAIYIPSDLANYASSTLSSLSATADNKARLDSIGIDTDNMFSIQVVEDTNQQREMEWLLRRAVSTSQNPNDSKDITGGLKGIVVGKGKTGKTLWVCPQCLECLWRRRSVKDYMTLMHYKFITTRESNMEVTLCNDLSVAFLTKSLYRTTSTKLIIHIIHGYFEAIEQTNGVATRRNAIVELFNQLGQALLCQKRLVQLEIHGRSSNGNMYSGTAYTGLNAVFRCRSLRTLRISGIPCLLQNKGIPINCRNLTSLSLRNIPFDSGEAASNFWKLIGTNTSLASLAVTASNLSLVKPWTALAQFPRLFAEIVHLDLSNNNLTAQVAADFAKVICKSAKRKLSSFILSNNMDIGDQGCLDVMAQFWRNHHWLDTLKLEDAGWKCPRTMQSYKEYMDLNKYVREL
ncbi:hypothetical protein BGX31_008826 [Mortierella sp. GBA43]|nr:hypothetical protein BGX31_008826 [Mortierella sp. GBA43]